MCLLYQLQLPPLRAVLRQDSARRPSGSGKRTTVCRSVDTCSRARHDLCRMAYKDN